MERRLAAILAADVVGYSRLIREDEAGTLAALKSHREQLIECLNVASWLQAVVGAGRSARPLWTLKPTFGS